MGIAVPWQGEIVRGIGTVREAGLAARWLRDVTVSRSAVILAILTNRAGIFLHPEKMRWQDKAVPHER